MKRNYMKLPRYNIYNTHHPKDTACGGTAILLKYNFKNHVLINHNPDYLQATNTRIENLRGPLTISAVYCPPGVNEINMFTFLKPWEKDSWLEVTTMESTNSGGVES